MGNHTNIRIDKQGLIDDITQAKVNDDGFDASSFFILPALVNSHFHSQSPFLAGLSKEMKIEDWGTSGIQGDLQKSAFAFLDQGASDYEFSIICQKSYIDLLRNGIGFCSDSGFGERNPKLLHDAMRTVGMTGIIDAYNHHPDLVSDPGDFACHLPEEEDLTTTTIQEAQQLKSKFDPIFMTHSLETQWRRNKSISDFGRSSIEVLDEARFLGPKTVLFHGVFMDETDIKTIAERRSPIAHCPISNLTGGNGIAPVVKWLENDITVGLGTDFACTDLWEVIRLAYGILKYSGGKQFGSAETVLKMATTGGANAYGKQQQLGKIICGYKANLLFLKRDHAAFIPMIHNQNFSTLCHHVLMGGRPEAVTHLMIEGEFKLFEGKIQNVNEAKINQEYNQIAKDFYQTF